MLPLDPITLPLDRGALIEASAGTGKTFTITTLYLRLLVEDAHRAGSVLVVTYTNAATAELRARLRTRVREALAGVDGRAPDDPTLAALVDAWQARGLASRARAHLAQALRDFDEAAVYTIHGFCQRMLRDYAFESDAPFAAELVTDETLLRDEIVRDFWARAAERQPEAVLRHLRRRLGPDRLAALARRVTADPTLPIVPAAAAASSSTVDAALAEARRALAGAGAIWERDRERILALVCDSPALKRNVYAPATVRGVWAPALDRLFTTAALPVAGHFEKLGHLTNAGLAGATRVRQTPPAHGFFDACDALARADTRLESAVAAAVQAIVLDFVRWARDERARRRAASGTQSFDDLLQTLRAALEGPGGGALAATIRRRFPFALIDESQDTDWTQHAIFRRIYAEGGVLCQVGDPKQAIFAFRGADVFTYLDAKRAHAAAVRTLATNWRSDPGLLAGVNTIFRRARQPFVLDEIPHHEVRPRPDAHDALAGTAAALAPLRILFLSGAAAMIKDEAERQVTAAVAGEIARLLASGATLDGRTVGAGDLAVLCRTNAQAVAMQDTLRTWGVASVLRGDKSVFDTREGEEMSRLLAALANPEDGGALRGALVTTALGVDGATVLRLRDDEQAWEEWARRFRSWHDAWTSTGFMRAFRLMLDDADVQARLLALTDGERRLTNLLHLAELLHRAEREGRLGPLQLGRWLARVRVDASARGTYAGDAEQIRLESDARAVTLVTIHRSKGLEYPIVFCPFLWAEAKLTGDDAAWLRFHDPAAGGRLTLDLGGPERERHLALAEREAFAENVRLLYVALTRARHHCSVVWGAFRGAERSALGYLLHQPPGAPADADLAAATAAHIQTLGEGGLRADLERLAADSGGAVAVAALAPAAAAPVAPSPPPTPVLEPRTLRRPIPRPWRTSSFTGLTAPAEAAERSVDAAVDRDAAALPAAETPSDGAAPIRLRELPGGVVTGRLLHAVLEDLDFGREGSPSIARAIAPIADRYRLEPHWIEPLADALADVLATPLDDATPPLALQRIAAADRMAELEFTLPVAAPPSAPTSAAPLLTPGSLADVFERHAAPAAWPAYAARLRRLGFQPFAGFLRGFIDLVFVHRGRWYLVDYKSNLLGPSASDYAPARLVGAMAAHDYFLQYHLYVVALHRHLTARLRGYSYDRDFGGVLYLFVRGMAPAHPPGYGVFRDRPPSALVVALSDALARGVVP